MKTYFLVQFTENAAKIKIKDYVHFPATYIHLFEKNLALPVKMLAWLLLRLNWVSRYFGRNTTNPETMTSSIQAARQVTT